MNNMPRFQLIQYDPDWPIPIESVTELLSGKFVGAGERDSVSPFLRKMDVHYALELVAWTYLGLPKPIDVELWSSRGFEAANNYFAGDWEFKGKPGLKYAQESSQEGVQWFHPFSRGLLLGMLANRWYDVAQFCEWPWVGLIPEYSGMGGDLEDEIAYLYVLMAGSFRKSKLDNVEELRKRLASCKVRRPRLLYQLWVTIENGDQPGFDTAVVKSLQQFAKSKRLENRDGNIAKRLALPQSTMVEAARHFGLKLPDLPDELSVFLLTRSRLGLDE